MHYLNGLDSLWVQVVKVKYGVCSPWDVCCLANCCYS